MLNRSTSDVNDSMSLDIFLSLPFVFEQKSRDLAVDIYFTSQARSINPNDMLEHDMNATAEQIKENQNINPLYETYLDRILTVYNVSDKILLLSLIADSVDEDLKERTTGSELALENQFFTQGKIYSLEHFHTILDEYKRQTLDFNVDAIPWETLLSFQNTGLDFNHIDVNTLSMLMPDLDETTLATLTTDRVDVYEDFSSLNIDPERVQELTKMKMGFYSPEVKAWMNIRNGTNHLAVTFSYNLETKKATHIEISN